MPDPALAAAFISYSREDSEFVLRLAKDLKAAGGQVWLDQLDIHPGHPWDVAVEGALNCAPQILLVLSPASAKSENVRDEISFALDAGKIIIPILFKDCIVPLRLQRIQRIDFRTDYAFGLADLLAQLQTVRHPSPSPPAIAPPLPQSPPSSPLKRRSVQAAFVALAILLILAIAYTLRPGHSGQVTQQSPPSVATSTPVPSATQPSPTPATAPAPTAQPTADPAKSPSSPSAHASRAASEAPPKIADAPSLQTLAGTKWNFTATGSDAFESYYDVVFSRDGTLTFQDAYSAPKHGSWKQHGNSVYIEVNGRYAEYNGHFVGSRLVGKGGNIQGATWTWFGEKSREKSVEKK